jgi:hypothetical protein
MDRGLNSILSNFLTRPLPILANDCYSEKVQNGTDQPISPEDLSITGPEEGRQLLVHCLSWEAHEQGVSSSQWRIWPVCSSLVRAAPWSPTRLKAAYHDS